MREKKNTWQLNEIILVAMICIVFGVVYLGAVYGASFISAALAATGLSQLGNEILFGVWFMMIYAMRKKQEFLLTKANM